MDEIIKYIAAGGSVTTGLLIYYVWRIAPRLESLEKTQLQGQQVDLIKLAKDAALSPNLRDKSAELLKTTEAKLESLT